MTPDRVRRVVRVFYVVAVAVYTVAWLVADWSPWYYPVDMVVLLGCWAYAETIQRRSR